MENFVYHNPTRVDFGQGREESIGEHLSHYAVKKVLICFGSDRIKRDGLFDRVVAQLKAHDIEYVELGGIVSNPILSKVREGVELANQSKADAILSVGGGSALDSAKAIAAGAHYQGDVWDLFIGKATVEQALPIFDILTLAATGSEMNSGAVVTNEETKQKYAINAPCLFPKVSMINPQLMSSVSQDYLVYSAADIIAHSIEGYFTATTQPAFQSRLVEAIINTVIETTERLLEDPQDYDARAQFAWASTQALNGLIYSGTAGFSYPNHMMEHSLSALFNVPHGGGLSVIMPAWMKWYYTQNTAQFTRFAKNVFNLETPEQGIEALEQWFNKIGTPTKLGQFNIGQDDFDAIVENMLGNASYFGISDIYTEDVLSEIMHNAL